VGRGKSLLNGFHGYGGGKKFFFTLPKEKKKGGGSTVRHQAGGGNQGEAGEGGSPIGVMGKEEEKGY